MSRPLISLPLAAMATGSSEAEELVEELILTFLVASMIAVLMVGKEKLMG